MITFNAKGHENILGTHKRTFEFTKDDELTVDGDCILGVKADFDINAIKAFVKGKKGSKVTVTIRAAGHAEAVHAELNKGFCDARELVVRKSDFGSERTFAVKADKACSDIKRELVNALKKPEQAIEVTLE